MPWTLSHPAAILPLKRLCPKYLMFPALVAGSVAPDVGYYIDQFAIGRYAHTFAGSILAGVPMGMLLLCAFFYLRRPLWFLLPGRHRHPLGPLVARRLAVDTRTIMTATASILLGAWTHLVWDSFTHNKTWIVSRIDLLREPWLRIGPSELYGYAALQDLSTLTGAVALYAVYSDWLRRQPQAATGSADGDFWRYFVLVGALLLSLAIAIVLAIQAGIANSQQAEIRVFIVRAAIYAVSSFSLLLIVYSVLFRVLENRTGRQEIVSL